MPQLTFGIPGSTPEFAVFTRSQALTLVEALLSTLLIREAILGGQRRKLGKIALHGLFQSCRTPGSGRTHGALTQLYAERISRLEAHLGITLPPRSDTGDSERGAFDGVLNAASLP